MAFNIFVQLLVNSLIAGSIYALVASGFSLIYSTSRFMHFAHGVSVVIGAYMLFQMYSLLHIPFLISCILVLIITGLFGYLMYKGIYSPLMKRKSSSIVLLIASVGLLILFENLILMAYGADVKTIGYIKGVHVIKFLGAVITPLQLVIIIASVLLLVLLWLFMHKIRIGRDMRAVADNPELSEIMGLNSKKIMALAFILGTVMAGFAGILIGMEQNLEPTMGMGLMIKGFTGAVIGGITSVPAAVLGSYIIGGAENFGVWFLPSGYKNAITFLLLFLFLLFKPTGLFGLNKGVKK